METKLIITSTGEGTGKQVQSNATAEGVNVHRHVDGQLT